MDVTDKDFELAGIPIQLSGLAKELRKALAKVQAEQGGGSARRIAFIQRLPFMGDEVINELLTNKLQIQEVQYYATKSVGATNIVEMFKGNDDEADGFCSLNKGKLVDKRPFLLTDIQLCYHTGASEITASNVGTFTPLVLPAEVYNGEWMMKYDNTEFISHMPIMTTFTPGVYARTTSVPAMTEDTDASEQAAYTAYPSYAFNTSRPHGLYTLDQPKLFKGGQSVSLNMKFPQSLSSTHHAFKVFLIGITVGKY